MFYLLLVFCLIGGCFATYPPFTNTFPQIEGIQGGNVFGSAFQTLPLTSGGSGTIGSIFPSTAPIYFSDGDIGTSRIISTQGSSSSFANPIQFSAFGGSLPATNLLVSPASFGSGVTMTPGSINMLPFNTFGSISSSSSLNSGLLGTSTTPIVVPEVSSSFINSQPLYVSPEITSVRYTIHSPTDLNIMSSALGFPLGESASLYPSYLRVGNHIYTGSDSLNLAGIPSIPSVTSMRYPAYQSMTTYPYYSTYRQNIGTGYPGMQMGYPQYMNQGMGSFPSLSQGMGSFPSINQGLGSYPSMNQGLGSYPSMNQGLGSYPSMNQGMGSFPLMNAGIGGVSGYPNYPYMWNRKRYHPKKRKIRPY